MQNLFLRNPFTFSSLYGKLLINAVGKVFLRPKSYILGMLLAGPLLLSSCAINEESKATAPVNPVPPPKKTKPLDETESPADRANRLELLRTGRPESFACTAAPAKPVSATQTIRPEAKKPKTSKKQSSMNSMADCWPKAAHPRKHSKGKPKRSVSTKPSKPEPKSQSAKKLPISAPKSKPTLSAKPQRVPKNRPKQPETTKKKIKSNLI